MMNLRVIALVALAARLVAQDAAELRFDAASVRRSTSDAPSGSTNMTPGLLAVKNVPLRSCIGYAYGLKWDNVIGPSWLDNDRYDITARTTSTEPAQMDKMYQQLLADRFGLRIHTGSKVVSGFELTVEPGGIRLKNVGMKPSDEPVVTVGRCDALCVASARGMTMGTLAGQLSSKLGTLVIDRTGTSDYFAGVMEWAPLDTSPFRTVPPEIANRPSVFQALNAMGLRLQAARVTAATIIVDSIERTPAEN